MSTEPPPPKVARRPSHSLVWAVPVVAAAVAAWMLIGQIRNRGPEIMIDFVDGSGVEADATVIEYKGVVIGNVTAVDLKPDLSGVLVEARLHRGAAGFARGGARFWVVHPEIGFSGIRGLDTLLKGVRISAWPGDGPATTTFVGLEAAPPPEKHDSGRSFVLEAERFSSLSNGAPVFFRDMKVGAVEASKLSADSRSVLIQIRIFKPYVDLVRANTRFWNAGGLSMKLSLLGGAELKNTSLESLLTGAIAFATPDGPLAPTADEGAVFALNTDADKDAGKWRPSIPLAAPESTPEAPPTRATKAAAGSN